MNKKISASLKQLVKINSSSDTNNDFEIVMFVNDLELAKKQITNLDSSIKIESFKFINALGLCVNFEFLEVLAEYKNVVHITCASKVLALSYRALDITNINKLHNMGLSGKGITVALIDTGTYPHLDLCFPYNKIKKFVNLIDERQNMLDDNGHGTFVSGLLAGRGIVSNRVHKGVAYNADLISIKAMNEKGETSAFFILKAMEWIFDNAVKYKIRVVCMSFGSEPLDEHDPLVLGAESLWDKGIVVVAAAGNSGPSSFTIKSPAISSKIITVGAADDGRQDIDFENVNMSFLNKPNYKINDKYVDKLNLFKCKVANFSSRGPVKNFFKPDILAPGVKIVGLNNDKKTPYTVMSGTSMATPIIAGLVCLMLEYNSSLTPRQIKQILLNAGRPISYNRNEEGSGLVDAVRCIIK